MLTKEEILHKIKNFQSLSSLIGEIGALQELYGAVDESVFNKQERDFLTDTVLNHYWNYCHEQLQRNHLGDMEKKNLEYGLNESKRIIKKIDPTLF